MGLDEVVGIKVAPYAGEAVQQGERGELGVLQQQVVGQV